MRGSREHWNKEWVGAKRGEGHCQRETNAITWFESQTGGHMEERGRRGKKKNKAPGGLQTFILIGDREAQGVQECSFLKKKKGGEEHR